MVSWAIGAFAAVRIVFAPLSGRAVSRWGELPVLCLGLLIVGGSSAACAYAADIDQLVIFRAAGGVGSTFFTVSSDLMLIRASSRATLGRASAAWSGAFLLGSVAGPAIGAALVPWGPRAPFLIYGGLLLATAFGALVLGRGRDVSGSALSTARGSIMFRAACRHRSFRAALCTNFLDGWTVQGMRAVLVPVFVIEVLGSTGSAGSAASGIALTVFAGGTAAGLPIGGWLADHHGRRLPASLGSAALVVTSVWLGLSSSVPEFLVAAALSGIGTGLVTPPANAAVGDLVAQDRPDGGAGSAMAGYQMIGDVGAVLGPLLIGVVADLGGWVVAFGTVAVVAAVSLGAWLRVRKGGEG